MPHSLKPIIVTNASWPDRDRTGHHLSAAKAHLHMAPASSEHVPVLATATLPPLLAGAAMRRGKKVLAWMAAGLVIAILFLLGFAQAAAPAELSAAMNTPAPHDGKESTMTKEPVTTPSTPTPPNSRMESPPAEVRPPEAPAQRASGTNKGTGAGGTDSSTLAASIHGSGIHPSTPASAPAHSILAPSALPPSAPAGMNKAAPKAGTSYLTQTRQETQAKIPRSAGHSNNRHGTISTEKPPTTHHVASSPPLPAVRDTAQPAVLRPAAAPVPEPVAAGATSSPGVKPDMPVSAMPASAAESNSRIIIGSGMALALALATAGLVAYRRSSFARLRRLAARYKKHKILMWKRRDLRKTAPTRQAAAERMAGPDGGGRPARPDLGATTSEPKPAVVHHALGYPAVVAELPEPELTGIAVVEPCELLDAMKRLYPELGITGTGPTSALLSLAGHNPENQDFAISFAFTSQTLGRLTAVVMADGCGGHRGGRQSSFTAGSAGIRAIMTSRNDTLLETAERALEEASRQVASIGTRLWGKNEFRCTIIILLAGRYEYALAHLGDGGVVLRRTSGDWERLLVPQRQEGTGYLTGSLGPTQVGRHCAVVAKRAPGDWLVAGSDGLFVDEIANLEEFWAWPRQAVETNQVDLQGALDRLVGKCLDSMPQIFDDNISAVVITTPPLPAPRQVYAPVNSAKAVAPTCVKVDALV